MIEQIISMAIETGLMAALFTGLLIYVLKDTRAREIKYQEMIEKLHDTLEVVKVIREDVIEIKKEIRKEKEKKDEKVPEKSGGVPGQII